MELFVKPDHITFVIWIVYVCMILPYKGGDTASWLFATAQNNAHTTRTSIAVFRYGKTE